MVMNKLCKTSKHRPPLTEMAFLCIRKMAGCYAGLKTVKQLEIGGTFPHKYLGYKPSFQWKTTLNGPGFCERNENRIGIMVFT